MTHADWRRTSCRMDDKPTNAAEFTVSELAFAVKRTIEEDFGSDDAWRIYGQARARF